jgi:MFS family permease
LSTVALALRSRTFRSLRRHHNYRLFFAGQIVSLAGSWMQNVALAWLVLSISRSPLAVAGLLFCRFAPFTLFGLFAGSIVDRLDTRRLVLWTQVAAMTVSAALAVVTLTGTATLPIVFVLATLGGIALVLDAPGRQSLTFEMVGRRELPNAVALNSGLLNASRVIGPALAGVLIATAGIGICFVVNTLSFVAVLAALLAMREDELYPVAHDRSLTVLAGTREGLAFAWRDRQVRAVLVVVTCVGLVGFNFNTLVPLLASDTLHVDARAFGLLSAAFGVGAFAGAIGTASLARATFRVFRIGALGFSLLLFALAPVHDALLAGILLVGIGASFTLFAANANAIVQLAAPDHLRGRLVALYLFAFVGFAPLGALLSGALAQAGGTRLAFVVAGTVGLVATAFATASTRTGSHSIEGAPFEANAPISRLPATEGEPA